MGFRHQPTQPAIDVLEMQRAAAFGHQVGKVVLEMGEGRLAGGIDEGGRRTQAECLVLLLPLDFPEDGRPQLDAEAPPRMDNFGQFRAGRGGF